MCRLSAGLVYGGLPWRTLPAGAHPSIPLPLSLTNTMCPPTLDGNVDTLACKLREDIRRWYWALP
jgi:hypothetical protein